MNRKIFVSLVVMMALSIIGITWVQIRWIRNAIGIRNENFNIAVFNSLNNAANTIDSRRRVNFFNNYMFPQAPKVPDTLGMLEEYINFGSYITNESGGFSINITNQSRRIIQSDKNILSSDLIIIGDSLMSSDSLSMIISPEDKPETVRILQEGDMADATDRTVMIKRSEFLEWVKKRSSEFQNLGEQMISEIFESEKRYDVGNEEIRYTLNQFFPYYGIQTPYEFTLIKNGEISETSSPRISKNEFLRSNYKVRLFPDNIVKKDVILSVVFPERTNYVLGSMTWILGGSLIFSLFIFSTFALSLYSIIRQKKISEVKSDFINNMTHEFKTPIATISLAADTITNPKVINDENSIRHFIGMIKRENSRMNKQVETILQIASLDKKEIDFRFEETDLHCIIERVVESMEIQVAQKGGTITSVLEASEYTIYGDPEHITNLVHNLLDNAIKYSPEKPEIKVITSNSGGGIIMSVEDKGIGMTKSVQAKIFERFYRKTSGDIHDVKGFGLGLNYVKAIVDAHKGNITVFSEPGSGSKFDIFLPLYGRNNDEQ